jgi:hypothetical protein
MSEPERLRVVPRELLEALAAEAPAAEPASPPPSGQKPAAGGRPRSRLLVEQWLNDRHVVFRRKGQPDGKGRTVWVLKECPFDSSHGDPDSCVMQAPDGALSAHCFHASCKGRGWQAFKEKIGPPEAHHYDPPLSGAKGGRQGQAHQGVPLGTLLLVVDRTRQSPSGRLTVTLRVLRDGQAVDLVNVFGTATGRRAAGKQLQALAGEVSSEAVAAALSAVFAEAARQLDEAPGPGTGPALREAVRAYVQQNFRPTRRAAGRVLLAAFGRAFDRVGFLHLVNTDMLTAVREAAKVPADEDEYQLLAKVELEMRIIFGDLLTTLPDERQALAATVVGMWATVKCLSKTKARDGTEHTVNIALIGLVQQLLERKQVTAGKWLRVHPAHPAFVRYHPVLDAEGEAIGQEVLLAMNAELATSTGVKLPEGFSPFGLKRVGKRHGVFRELPGVSGHGERGKTRVMVLSRKLTDYLLDDVSRARSPGGDGGSYGNDPFGTGEQG